MFATIFLLHSHLGRCLSVASRVVWHGLAALYRCGAEKKDGLGSWACCSLPAETMVEQANQHSIQIIVAKVWLGSTTDGPA
jgi:hypothetical protein